ncbi:MAG: acyl carrier protein [Chitinophagales bacterium]|nr:acyl carrier protein [Chitinophagales bacterium]
MERESILEKLTGIFRKVFDNNSLEVTESVTANDVEKWDSLTNIIMVDEVEKEFGIKFKLKEIMKLRNVGDLITVIQDHSSQ